MTAVAPKRTAHAAWCVAATVFIYAMGLLYAAYALADMLRMQATSPRWLFGYKRRSRPPKCLQDPDLGEHGYLTVNGVKFHYVEKGDKSKPLMLFLHGFPDFWYSWRHQMKEFSADYWTVTLDLRGYGGSSKPTNVFDYDIFVLVEDTKGIVTELGRSKFTLVAHDWGAIIGWTFLETYPEMIDKYVLMNCPSLHVFSQLLLSIFSSNQLSKSWYTYMFQIPYVSELYMSFGDFVQLRELLLAPKTSNPYFTDDDIEAYKYTFSQPGAAPGPFNYYRAACRKMILQGLFPKDLRPKKGPAPRPRGLFIFGAMDIALDVKCVALHKAQTANLETCIIEEGNHFVNQGEPVAVNNAMRSFLLP